MRDTTLRTHCLYKSMANQVFQAFLEPLSLSASSESLSRSRFCPIDSVKEAHVKSAVWRER